MWIEKSPLNMQCLHPKWLTTVGNFLCSIPFGGEGWKAVIHLERHIENQGVHPGLSLEVGHSTRVPFAVCSFHVGRMYSPRIQGECALGLGSRSGKGRRQALFNIEVQVSGHSQHPISWHRFLISCTKHQGVTTMFSLFLILLFLSKGWPTSISVYRSVSRCHLCRLGYPGLGVRSRTRTNLWGLSDVADSQYIHILS